MVGEERARPDRTGNRPVGSVTGSRPRPEDHVRRLHWRAGFGVRSDEAARLADVSAGFFADLTKPWQQGKHGGGAGRTQPGGRIACTSTRC